MIRWLVVLGLLLLSRVAVAACPSPLPFTLINGTIADATQVMANFNALQSCGFDPANTNLTGGTLSGFNITGGKGLTANPYTAVFPAGAGSTTISYPDTSQYVTDFITAGIGAQPSGTHIYNNQLPYGDLDTSCAASFSVGSNRPCGSTGYTALTQIGAVQLQDAIALTTQSDTIPPFGPFAGTFTATTFTPSSSFAGQNVTWPFQTTTSVPIQSLLRKGMWVRTNTRPYWRGMISDPGSGLGFTVFGWQEDGAAAGFGTPPASGSVVINDTVGFYSGIHVAQANVICSGSPCTQPTGSLTNSTTTISSLSSTAGLFVGQLISATNLTTAVITSINYAGSSLTVSGNGPSGIGGGGTATQTLFVSASLGNQFRSAEIDVGSAIPYSNYVPEKITGCTAVAGNYQLTGCSSIPTDVRQWLTVASSNASIVSGASVVVSRDSSSAITLNIPALMNGTVDLTFHVNPVEGGAGFDMGGTQQIVQTGVNTRGNFVNGFRSGGAFNASFLVQPDGTAAIPPIAYEVDCAIAGCPTGFAFELHNTRTGAVLASIDPVGNVFGSAQGTFSTLDIAFGSAVGVPASFAGNIHETTNVNISLGAGSLGGLAGAGVWALKDDGATAAELDLIGSSIKFSGVVGFPSSNTGAVTPALTNAPTGCTTVQWIGPLTIASPAASNVYLASCHS